MAEMPGFHQALVSHESFALPSTGSFCGVWLVLSLQHIEKADFLGRRINEQ